MDQELLIERVTQELMRRLEALEGKGAGAPKETETGKGKGKPWLAAGPERQLSCEWPGLEYWENFDNGLPDYARYEGIVIPSLPANQLVLASLGMQYGMESNLIVGGLLAGVPVYASERGLDWLDALKPGSPLRRYYEECRKRLTAFGVAFFSEEPAASQSAPAPSGPAEQGPVSGCGVVDLSDRRVLSEREVKEACKAGCTEVLVGPRAVITPLAQDHLRLIGVRVTPVAGARP